ncbi:MAG: hypothetical protein VYE07_05150, partial [Actinomycetota bacterium]|nr:hypothetical protein [Actinomycetota bacterium]
PALFAFCQRMKSVQFSRNTANGKNMCTLATHGQETETKPTEASRPMDGMGTRRNTAGPSHK